MPRNSPESRGLAAIGVLVGEVVHLAVKSTRNNSFRCHHAIDPIDQHELVIFGPRRKGLDGDVQCRWPPGERRGCAIPFIHPLQITREKRDLQALSAADHRPNPGSNPTAGISAGGDGDNVSVRTNDGARCKIRYTPALGYIGPGRPARTNPETDCASGPKKTGSPQAGRGNSSWSAATSAASIKPLTFSTDILCCTIR